MIGNMMLSSWDEGKEDWKVMCCLRGFEPKSTEEWNRGNWTSGCVRRTPLQCERVNTSSDAGKMDGFLKLNMMKVPDFADSSSPHDRHECSQQCLESCLQVISLFLL
uniref:Apple domain-containing protein n=1 Tax=Fagus sylvatica TaxID=28930 RepID=A0A2N9HWH5_FAGSY